MYASIYFFFVEGKTKCGALIETPYSRAFVHSQRLLSNLFSRWLREVSCSFSSNRRINNGFHVFYMSRSVPLESFLVYFVFRYNFAIVQPQCFRLVLLLLLLLCCLRHTHLCLPLSSSATYHNCVLHSITHRTPVFKRKILYVRVCPDTFGNIFTRHALCALIVSPCFSLNVSGLLCLCVVGCEST